MNESLGARLIDDPEIAANINRLVAETGIPRERYERLLCSDPPTGISPEDWIDALADRGRNHGPWPEDALRTLSRMATTVHDDQAPAA
ncbi:hypothetical protein F4561_002603 [Lipingzhangella halophila]|uniref:Uncharacterized protein n=1 Tax=Lipingzhangella halophila TaxID=1783352 RepID=A0A7W7W2T9_9ACTN|nr:hypothetical protein [Lipingzhangella halophila]MBB4931783.1 hypothetical protein [Lipingzhangella halophila]